MDGHFDGECASCGCPRSWRFWGPCACGTCDNEPCTPFKRHTAGVLPALREPLPEIPVGPGIFVHLGKVPPENECMAAQCTGEAVAHALWLSTDWSRLEWPIVCAAHATALRDYRCVIVPIGMLPPEHVLVQAVEAEIARRRPQPHMVFHMTNTMTGFNTFSPTAGFYVQWG